MAHKRALIVICSAFAVASLAAMADDEPVVAGIREQLTTKLRPGYEHVRRIQHPIRRVTTEQLGSWAFTKPAAEVVIIGNLTDSDVLSILELVEKGVENTTAATVRLHEAHVVVATLELKTAAGPLERQLYVLQATDSSEIVAATGTLAPHFAVFLAWDATSVSTEEISRLAKLLHNWGLAYLCAFGPDCERVHDIFDEVHQEMLDARPSDSVIMTTWHDDESLEDALWFFVNNSYPDAVYQSTCQTGIAVTIGNSQWGSQIADYLSDLAKLNAAVGV